MKIIKYIFLIACIFIASISNASSAEIHSPYAASNPNSLDMFKGYCKNTIEEKKLWSEINKFAKSFQYVIPKIPPEQKAYLQSEFTSGNTERAINVSRNSFYKMNETYEEIVNIENLSTSYLANHNQLSLNKKMEFIGRTLVNLNSEHIAYDEMQYVSADLNSKGYVITKEVLLKQWALKRLINKSLIFHLICYGEK